MSRIPPPCKRPKVRLVTIDDGLTGTDLVFRAMCWVPTCDWSYGPALKTDAEQQATRHRGEHRDAVPTAWIEHDVEYDVHCEPCGGHRRTFGTRVDAQAWLDHHLSVEHGLVVCS